jgi:hypothetical protein
MLWIYRSSFDIQYIPKLSEQCIFKILCRLRSLWYPLIEIWYDRRGNNQPDGKTRLEGVAVSNIANLGHVCLNKLQSMAFNEPTPLADKIFNASCSRSDPLKFKVEACRGVVNNVMVQYHGFCLVTLLEFLMSTEWM